MALGELRRGTLLLRPVDEVAATDDVYHVDQLSPADLEAFLHGVADGEAAPNGLEPGDVVVFTDYYRLETV